MGQAQTRAYHAGKLQGEDFPVAEVSEHLARDDTFVWVDLVGPTKDDLAELADELGLHELAVEDALEPGALTDMSALHRRTRDALVDIAAAVADNFVVEDKM